MAKFLNKKEQVIDFKLTNYGHYLLSVGTFKPVYYAFFDDNILYDSRYGSPHQSQSHGRHGQIGTGSQNSIHERIKENTPYLESLTVFSNIDYTLQQITSGSEVGKDYFESDVNPTLREPAPENLRFNSMIGDAALDGNTKYAPAWKVVTLQGEISSSTDIDAKNEVRIPQVNVDLNYVKKVVKRSVDLAPDNIRNLTDRVIGFADGNMIQLQMDDPLIYAEEINTELFMENFDIEIFKVVAGDYGCNGTIDPLGRCLGEWTGSYMDTFERKYFEKEVTPVVDGFLKKSPTGQDLEIGIAGTYVYPEPTTDAVSYYFNIHTDHSIDRKMACKAAEIFNKSSYYIDLDFDCALDDDDDLVFVDIYGRVTESEICPT